MYECLEPIFAESIVKVIVLRANCHLQHFVSRSN